MAREGEQLSIKLLWILERLYNKPSLESLDFNYLYSVSEITWDSFNSFQRSVICFSMFIKKFKCFSLAIKFSENLLESDRIFRLSSLSIMAIWFPLSDFCIIKLSFFDSDFNNANSSLFIFEGALFLLHKLNDESALSLILDFKSCSLWSLTFYVTIKKFKWK